MKGMSRILVFRLIGHSEEQELLSTIWNAFLVSDVFPGTGRLPDGYSLERMQTCSLEKTRRTKPLDVFIRYSSSQTQ